MLVEQVNLKHKDLEKAQEELDTQQRTNKLQQAVIEKQRLELEDYKTRHFDLQYEYASNPSSSNNGH